MTKRTGRLVTPSKWGPGTPKNDELRSLKRKYEEITWKVGTSSTVDQLLASTSLPYTEEVLAFPLPLKFRIPAMETYDGSRDPLEHLETFRAHMTLHGFPREVTCRAFPLALKGSAHVWFRSLAPKLVDSFDELARLFLTQFMSSWRTQSLAAYLFTIKQTEDESLKSYLAQFNKECMTADDQDKKITLAALLGGVWLHSQFMVELARRTPATLLKFMDQADSFINTEGTLRVLIEPQRKAIECRKKGEGPN